LESAQFYMHPQVKSLPGSTKAKLASLPHAANQWREMPHKDSKVQLAVELGPRVCILQEQFPSKPAGGMSQKWAQSGRQLWPRQLLDGS
jgi:hypothetical protein